MMELLHSAGRLICGQVHPLDDGSTMPLCARCSGMYLSFAVTMLMAALGVMTGGKKEGSGRLIMATVLASAAPIHALFFPDADSLRRFASGSMTGAGIAILVGGSIGAGVFAIVSLIILAATRSTAVHGLFAYLTIPAMLSAVAIPTFRIYRALSSSSYRLGTPGAGNEIMVTNGE